MMQENAPELAVGRADAEGDVDCVTAKERMSKCDAACPPGLRAPQAFKGHEVSVASGVVAAAVGAVGVVVVNDV